MQKRIDFNKFTTGSQITKHITHMHKCILLCIGRLVLTLALACEMLIPPPGSPSTEFHGNVVGVTVVQDGADREVEVQYTSLQDNSTEDTGSVRLTVQVQEEGENLPLLLFLLLIPFLLPLLLLLLIISSNSSGSSSSCSSSSSSSNSSSSSSSSTATASLHRAFS